MAELKTKPSDESVEAFINSIDDEKKRKESFELIEMMMEVTGEKPRLWGGNIIGFGDYHYKYASGREGDWFKIGFSPRKQKFSLYFMTYLDNYESFLNKLGKFKTGKGCLYVNKLDDIDPDVLKEMIRTSVEDLLKGSA